MADRDGQTVENRSTWSQRLVTLVEACCNMLFYLFAFFILIVPPLKWLSDIFSGAKSTWMVAAAALIFAIILPAITPAIANLSMLLIEKIRRGELMASLFRPLRAICAVVSIFGVLALEYKTIHGGTDKSLFEVYLELIKSL